MPGAQVRGTNTSPHALFSLRTPWAPNTLHLPRPDVPAILSLIRSLASYENFLDTIHTTEESLLRNIAFAEHSVPLGVDGASDLPDTEPVSAARPARCLLVFPSGSGADGLENDGNSEGKVNGEDGEPAGLALYFYSYSTWLSRPGIHLEDLFVRKQHRGKGYGKALLRQLAREVLAMGGGRLDWSVLRQNEQSIAFYESEAVGARAMGEWLAMRVEGGKLGRLAGL